MERTPEYASFLNGMTERMFGRRLDDAISNDMCVTCGKEATEFEDALSAREYEISGMCQKCQNKTFG